MSRSVIQVSARSRQNREIQSILPGGEERGNRGVTTFSNMSKPEGTAGEPPRAYSHPPDAKGELEKKKMSQKKKGRRSVGGGELCRSLDTRQDEARGDKRLLLGAVDGPQFLGGATRKKEKKKEESVGDVSAN